jgi:hypothetical protein
LSKYIPPKPSDPASIPIARKIGSVGTPSLEEETVLAKTLTIISIEIASKIYSSDMLNKTESSLK